MACENTIEQWLGEESAHGVEERGPAEACGSFWILPESTAWQQRAANEKDPFKV